MSCLWCDQEIILEISWKNIFRLPKPKLLCEACEAGLEVLQGDLCYKCSRMTAQEICRDCILWLSDNQSDPLVSNYSVFTYNEQMQSMIAKWKYRGDYILADAFKQLFIEKFEKKFSSLIESSLVIPIPLSQRRLQERGFNQAKVLADFLPINNVEILTRDHNEKQAKKTRSERITMENPFKITDYINKKVILVDDIYTTGSTLRHAAFLLRKHGCPEVYAYTLIRG
jgi:competence protein ComFC